MFGSVEGRHHDSSMWVMSGIMSLLENFSIGLNEEKLCDEQG